MPPPKKRPFATTTSNMRPVRRSSPTWSSTSAACQREKTANVAQRYETFPPSALVVSFARLAIAPLIPALATFANTPVASLPSQARYDTRPRSIVRVSPSRATRAAWSTSRGIPNVRTKSQPVPRGTTAISGGSAMPTSPFATS